MDQSYDENLEELCKVIVRMVGVYSDGFKVLIQMFKCLMFRTLVAKPAGIFARRGGSVSASMSGSSFKMILK